MAVKLLHYNETGQALRHTPAYRVATAAWELHDLMVGDGSSDYVLASGSGTLDTVSTTLDADAGPSTTDPKLVPLLATTGIAAASPNDPDSGLYELATAEGEAEIVKVVGIESDDYVRLAWPLVRSYAFGSTFRGLTFTTGTSADINTTVAQESRVDRYEPLRIVWNYGGRFYQDQVRIVREDEGDLDVPWILGFLRDTFPGIDVRTEHHGPTLERKVYAAYRSIASKNRSRQTDPLSRLTGDQLNLAVAWRVLYVEAASGNTPGARGGVDAVDWLDFVRGEYSSAMGDLLVGPGGVDTVQVDRPTRSAEAVSDIRHRKVIGEL